MGSLGCESGRPVVNLLGFRWWEQGQHQEGEGTGLESDRGDEVLWPQRQHGSGRVKDISQCVGLEVLGSWMDQYGAHSLS